MYLSLAYCLWLSSHSQNIRAEQGANNTRDLSLMTQFPLLLTVDVVRDTISDSEWFDFISKFEGIRSIPHKDIHGYEVGFGHRLTNQDSSDLTKEYSSIEIVHLFRNDLAIALKGAKSLYPNFDKLPRNVRLVIGDLSYNLGKAGLAKFVKFKSAVDNGNWQLAAAELENSKYFKQVGIRAKNHVATLNSLGQRDKK